MFNILSVYFLFLIESSPLIGDTILMVIAHKGFNDKEYRIPKGLFQKLGATVITASSKEGVAEGMYEMKVEPDMLVKEVEEVERFSGIIFVGGIGCKEYWEDKWVHTLVKKGVKSEKVKVIGAICLAPIILVKAGVLKWKDATCWVTPETKHIFNQEKVRFKKNRVVVSGKIITANGPIAAKEFAEKIVEMLKKKKGSKNIKMKGGEVTIDGIINVRIEEIKLKEEEVEVKVVIKNITQTQIRSMELTCILYDELEAPVGIATYSVIKSNNPLEKGEQREFTYNIETQDPTKVKEVRFKIKRYFQPK